MAANENHPTLKEFYNSEMKAIELKCAGANSLGELADKLNTMKNATTDLTLTQLRLIAHSLGIDLLRAVVSLKREHKELPKEFYRNRYNSKPGCSNHDEVLAMVTAGLMEEGNENFFHVTEAGVVKFSEKYAELVCYKKKQDRDVAYLEHRINFYCDFFNYRFCDDNAFHVIDAYKTYYMHGERVSHTTEDVINKFKAELARFFKKQKV